MSQDREVTTPLSTSTFKSELNDAVGLNALPATESGARYYANQSAKITATMPAKLQALAKSLCGTKTRQQWNSPKNFVSKNGVL